METRLRLIVWGIVALIAVTLAADVAVSLARLNRVLIEDSLDPPSVVADGKSTVVITLRVTEDGAPRARALLQLWVGVGQGLLVQTWVYTDEQGKARVTFQPSPASKYAPVTDDTTIHVVDTTIGRLIEIRKEHVVVIPLEMPK